MHFCFTIDCIDWIIQSKLFLFHSIKNTGNRERKRKWCEKKIFNNLIRMGQKKTGSKNGRIIFFLVVLNPKLDLNGWWIKEHGYPFFSYLIDRPILYPFKWHSRQCRRKREERKRDLLNSNRKRLLLTIEYIYTYIYNKSGKPLKRE